MFIPTRFNDPRFEFYYLDDKILWGKIWKEPYRFIDGSQKIMLNHYFSVRNLQLLSKKHEFKQRKALDPTDAFHDASYATQTFAFVGLCEFLVRYGRRYRDCYVELPRHDSIVPIEIFHPMQMYYRSPIFPLIEKDLQQLVVEFRDPNVFTTVHNYIFGLDEPVDLTEKKLLFSADLFRGFTLQH